MRVNSQRFALPLVMLLGLIFFLFDLSILDVEFWEPCLLLLVVVYRWGRRTDIYVAAAIMCALVIIDYQIDVGMYHNLFNHLLAFVVLWTAAWLLAQHRTLQDKLVVQQQQLLHHEKELEEEVKTRTAALQAGEQQLAKIVRSNPGGIAITRQADGCYLDANTAYLAMVGYTREQLIGRTSLELGIVTPEERAQARAAAQEKGYGRGLDMQIFNSRGQVVDTLYSVEQLDFEGEPCFLVLAMDISDRKRMEQELRRSEERFATLFKVSPAGICLSRVAGGTYLDANPAYIGLLGYSREELLGHTPIELGIVTAAHSAELSERARIQGRGRALETQLTAKDGSNVAVLSSSEPVAIDGEECHMIVTVDITARQQAEARVQETLQCLQLATDAADIGIWNWNLVDSSLEWDERTCAMYAVPADLCQDGISYEFWRGRIHPDDLAVADPDHGDPKRVGDRWSDTYRIVLPDGTIRYIQSAAIMEYGRDGLPRRMIGINRDVTAQQYYEQLLEDTNVALEQRVATRTADLQAALAELKRANQLKDEFMAMISHELRTPLTGALTMSEMLEDQIAGPLNERQAYYVKGITESGTRLLTVVNGILSYTHLISGKVELRREPCDLASLLGICAASQQKKAAAKRQTVAVCVDPADLAITSDATAIADVLKRLLDNAVKFTLEDGQIGLEAQIGAEPNTIELVVWDTGIGIAAGQLEQIVKPFTQVDGRLSRSHEGVGMGLAVVDQMVRLLGGTLGLDSEPQRGSRFTVTLPTQPPPR